MILQPAIDVRITGIWSPTSASKMLRKEGKQKHFRKRNNCYEDKDNTASVVYLLVLTADGSAVIAKRAV